MKVGFVGLGSMGVAMASNLLKAGHHVRVWNRSRGPMLELASRGAEIAATPADAFQGDACISMLSNDEVVRHVVMDGDMIPASGSSTTHINMATISVSLARELTQFHASREVPYISAPVFGARAVAESAKLNILAAGDADTVDRFRSLFEAIGQKTWYVGSDPSQANLVKIAGNFMVASAIEAMAESAALVKASGLEAHSVLEILTTALFNVPVYRHYANLIAGRKFEPAGFKLTLGLKDVDLAIEAAASADLQLSFANVLRSVFLEAISQGHGNKDWSAIAEVAAHRH